MANDYKEWELIPICDDGVLPATLAFPLTLSGCHGIRTLFIAGMWIALTSHRKIPALC
ncbi:hypothetical protein [Lacimicrobium sp. SS2-24]|uniref:hypothetical protein n=1 Tax=Lacimicrobium sp. SS2-24 TaxID=2005569 RepID=UPI00143BB660|nr:hypothetical protein [Lacimicrobium sp. SS2-24]